MKKELNQLMREVLEQMAEIKGNKYKQNYLVEEIEFHLSLSLTENGKVGASLLGLKSGIDAGSENVQTVRIILKPKKNDRNNNLIISI